MPNKNHHLILLQLSLKNLWLGDAPPQTYAQTENLNDINTFMAFIVQVYNCAAVKPVEVKYAKRIAQITKYPCSNVNQTIAGKLPFYVVAWILTFHVVLKFPKFIINASHFRKSYQSA